MVHHFSMYLVIHSNYLTRRRLGILENVQSADVAVDVLPAHDTDADAMMREQYGL